MFKLSRLVTETSREHEQLLGRGRLGYIPCIGQRDSGQCVLKNTWGGQPELMCEGPQKVCEKWALHTAWILTFCTKVNCCCNSIFMIFLNSHVHYELRLEWRISLFVSTISPQALSGGEDKEKVSLPGQSQYCEVLVDSDLQMIPARQ